MADYNINAVTRRVVFTGSAGLGPYAFTFEVLDDDDLAIYFNTTKLTKTTDYSVTINANGTGSVTVVVNVGGNIPATPDANDTIIILGARDIERVTDFVTAGDLLASSLNQQLDSLTIFDQQVAEEQKRSMQAPVYDPAHVDDGGSLDMTLPAKDTRKGKTLQFNATTGNPEAGPAIDAVANAQTKANEAAASATAAASSATSASGSATTATTKAAEASTSAAAAAASQTASAASETASAASQAASAASQTAAASSASSASTSAATSTTKAAEAATSASNASTSETNSAASATAAASSATAAAASQTAAAASAASAASAFDNFDDTYLGSKTSNPTVDNDGDALVAGALYFNSTANEMRVYDGANWIAATSAGNVSLILYEYTATSGQTTFSGSDDNSATLSYTADNLQVVMNGVILDPSDFTASNGTSVVLASGAATNDLVNIYAFKSFTTADMVSKTNGGTFAGAVTVPQLNADNIRIDGNTISSIDTNGNVNIDPNGTGVTAIAGGFTATDGCTITTADNDPQLTLVSTDADASRGPELLLYRNSASPANSDALGFIRWDGENDAGAQHEYIKFEATIAASSGAASGAEQGRLDIRTMVSGTDRSRIDIDYDGTVINQSAQDLDFRVESSSASHMLTVNGGDNRVGINIDPTDANVVSTGGESLVVLGAVGIRRDGGAPLGMNRQTNDGDLIVFRAQGVLEGTISVSGTTVSYNGGHLSRYSQLSDNTKDTSIVKGTVMTNLDQMAVWHHEAKAATYYTEDDELPDGVSVGDEKTPAADAYDEDNEQLNCMAVSSVEGDANVAGVFVNWDDDDEDYANDMNIAMTGDMVIRIAQGTTVARGDLLMSAGDGTAKSQGDDIVRSKTIAKVTSTTVSHTYGDGSYLVPCVLMAC